MTIGNIFKEVVPDEDDEERRELERLVQNAAGKKKKEKSKHGKHSPSPPAEKEKEKIDAGEGTAKA